jgi:hypothetical protein
MRDLIGHDQKPAAFIVYLHLYGQAARNKWHRISASVRTMPTQQDSPKAPSTRRSHICGADN